MASSLFFSFPFVLSVGEVERSSAAKEEGDDEPTPPACHPLPVAARGKHRCSFDGQDAESATGSGTNTHTHTHRGRKGTETDSARWGRRWSRSAVQEDGAVRHAQRRQRARDAAVSALKPSTRLETQLPAATQLSKERNQGGGGGVSCLSVKGASSRPPPPPPPSRPARRHPPPLLLSCPACRAQAGRGEATSQHTQTKTNQRTRTR